MLKKGDIVSIITTTNLEEIYIVLSVSKNIINIRHVIYKYTVGIHRNNVVKLNDKVTEAIRLLYL